jgi:hypothetical protein
MRAAFSACSHVPNYTWKIAEFPSKNEKKPFLAYFDGEATFSDIIAPCNVQAPKETVQAGLFEYSPSAEESLR